VVDVPLDYKLLLRCNWTYAMTSIIPSIFHTLCFPHDGKIVAIDQFYFLYVIPSAFVGRSIPMVDSSQPTTNKMGVELYSSLMGTFDLMALVHHIYAMSSRPISS
jgi:hypothetical protein